MSVPGDALVFDTGPLRHFAKHGNDLVRSS